MISPTQASTAKPRVSVKPLDENRGRVPPGSLLISDLFVSDGPAESHGLAVTRAALSVGFEGPLFYQSAVEQPLPPLREHFEAGAQLTSADLSPDEVHGALHRFSVGPPLHMLGSGIDEVERAATSLPRNSVLNLSSGTCKAQVVSQLYRAAASAWTALDPQEREGGRCLLRNLAKVEAIDLSKLLAGSAEESDSEKNRLQQSIIDRVDQSWAQEPRIERLQQEFARAVSGLESAHNSVVIAAGNEGLIKPGFEYETGLEVQVPEDFEQNVLHGPDTTSVGATIVLDGVEATARYSSLWPGVDLHASGDRQLAMEFDPSQGLKNAGSSLAAPRVGALMSRIHRDHPELDSDQVEDLVKSRFLSSGSMLDTSAAQDYLLAG